MGNFNCCVTVLPIGGTVSTMDNDTAVLNWLTQKYVPWSAVRSILQ